MRNIHIPLIIKDDLLGPQQVLVNADVFVDLQDTTARGIHMSRMYLSLNRLSNLTEVGYTELADLAKKLVELQQGLSTAAKLNLAFDLSVQRQSLVSRHDGWLTYPVAVRMINRQDKINCQLDIEVAYASTCPCSAALARQRTATQFAAHFKRNSLTPAQGKQWIEEQEKLTAIPHSQRSLAQLSFVIEPGQGFPFIELIDRVEKTLKLPVQTVVKRADEQDFARLTGENLMFCEDAARSLSNTFADYAQRGLRIKVYHLESLHPHDAVAQVRFGSLLE